MYIHICTYNITINIKIQLQKNNKNLDKNFTIDLKNIYKFSWFKNTVLDQSVYTLNISISNSFMK
jgi:hypothetical protein